MEAAQNLKRTLGSLGRKILREVSSHFTEPEEKQILKRPDNSSQMEFSQRNLTTKHQDTTTVISSTDTSEKIISEIEIESVSKVQQWALKRIDSLHDQDRHKNAKALAAEFDEWINIPDGTEELDYLCIEEEGWTDQEIDVREPNA